MLYTLVLQWPACSLDDYDALIAMEDLLVAGLPEAHGFVDGHDSGSGEMNIFVHTDQPVEAFADAVALLGANTRWAEVRAAYSLTGEDHYEILWPETLTEFSVS